METITGNVTKCRYDLHSLVIVYLLQFVNGAVVMHGDL